MCAPAGDLAQRLGWALLDDRGGAGEHEAGLGVEADDLALGQELPADPRGARRQVELELLAADQARLPELAGDDGA